MQARCWVLVALSLPAWGCQGDGDDDAHAGPPEVVCEIASTTELADADTIAPNGRTGAEMLAAIPASSQATLQWYRSTSYAEVELPEVTADSTTLDLSFSLPPEPTFHYVDRAAVPGAEVICVDHIMSTLDVHAATQDGALAFDLPAVEVYLAAEDPDLEELKFPFVVTKVPLASPLVEFVAPVMQPADSEKTLTLSFADTGVRGALEVFATTPTKTHRLIVARW